jgi:acyl-CoA hydrolase
MDLSIDSLNFITSSGVGDVVTIRSVVSRSFISSMEVYVSVEAGK